MGGNAYSESVLHAPPAGAFDSSLRAVLRITFGSPSLLSRWPLLLCLLLLRWLLLRSLSLPVTRRGVAWRWRTRGVAMLPLLLSLLVTRRGVAWRWRPRGVSMLPLLLSPLVTRRGVTWRWRTRGVTLRVLPSLLLRLLLLLLRLPSRLLLL